MNNVKALKATTSVEQVDVSSEKGEAVISAQSPGGDTSEEDANDFENSGPHSEH